MMHWFGILLALAAEPKGEVHFLTTQDGAQVALHHRPADGPPVLLVHGISSNYRCWDLEEGRSLASTLQRAGRDVWLLDLRGHGATKGAKSPYGSRRGWSVDDYGRYDLPAAIEFVLKKTEASELDYVGHSMGGLVVTVALAHRPELPLDRMVILATPMDFTDPDLVSTWGLALGRTLGFFLSVLPSPLAARIHGRFRLPLPVDEMLFTDLSSPARERMYDEIVSPLFLGELRQLWATSEHAYFMDEDHEQRYIEELSSVRVPTRVIAGRGDRIAPVDRVYGFYSALHSAPKDFVVAGKATGFSADYGHLDLPLGDHAEAEIYPLVLEWLTMDEEASK